MIKGMGRIGTGYLTLEIGDRKFPTGKHVYDELIKRLLTFRDFNGNNICNIIESMSRMKSNFQVILNLLIFYLDINKMTNLINCYLKIK